MKWLIAVVVLLSAGQVQAGQIFTTSQGQFDAGIDNQGWWSSTHPSGSTTSTNYYTGSTVHKVLRSFFTYDLSGFSGTAESATLNLRQFGIFQDSVDATETLELFDVTTAAAIVNNNVGTSQAIFDDLGSGTSFGTLTFATNLPGTTVLTFSLNTAGIAAINNAAGGYFTIGVSLTSDDGDDRIFTSSGSSGLQTLDIETSPVPEPTSLTLLAIGAVSLFGYGWRRKRTVVSLCVG